MRNLPAPWLSGCRWPVRFLVSAGGEYDVFRSNLTRRRSDDERPIVRGLQAGHRDAFAYRRAKALCVGHKVIDDLVPRHEPVRITSAIVAARELDRPVGNDKAEAVPSPAPGLADPASLEDEVCAIRRDEFMAE